jgi:hypothetical protein
MFLIYYPWDVFELFQKILIETLLKYLVLESKCRDFLKHVSWSVLEVDSVDFSVEFENNFIVIQLFIDIKHFKVLNS